MSLWTRHFVAGCVHLLAFGLLLGFGLYRASSFIQYSDVFWFIPDKVGWSPRQWRYRCGVLPCNATAAANATDACQPIAGCSDDEKRFFVVEPSNAVNVNVLVLACLYVLWSSIGHFIVWYTNKYHRVYKWYDYAVTAPTMLATLGLIYGCDSLLGIVIMPVVLAVLLILAGVLEREAKAPTLKLGTLHGLAIVGLILVYCATIAPVLYASYQITRPADPDPSDPKYVGRGEAPVFVFAFSVATVCVFFSSFAFLYAYDCFVSPLSWRNAGYITLSMIAKTTLHLFIGLTVVESAATISRNDPDPARRSEMDTLGIGLGGAVALVVGLTALNIWGNLADDSVPSGYAKLNLQ